MARYRAAKCPAGLPLIENAGVSLGGFVSFRLPDFSGRVSSSARHCLGRREDARLAGSDFADGAYDDCRAERVPLRDR